MHVDLAPYFFGSRGPKALRSTRSNYSISVLVRPPTAPPPLKSYHQSLLTSASLFANIVQMPTLQCFLLVSARSRVSVHMSISVLARASHGIRFIKAHTERTATGCQPPSPCLPSPRPLKRPHTSASSRLRVTVVRKGHVCPGRTRRMELSAAEWEELKEK